MTPVRQMEESHHKSLHKSHSGLNNPALRRDGPAADSTTGTEDGAPANIIFRAPARLKCAWKIVNKGKNSALN